MINLNNVIENDIEYEIYKSKINEIEKYLKTFGKTGFWDIIKNVGGSERRMLRLINEMEKEGIISFDKKSSSFYLTGDDKKKHDSYKCHKCNGSCIEIDKFSRLDNILDEIWENKPLPTLLFDQRPVTRNTSLKRVAYLLTKNDVYNKNIVFLGDDDLTSICLGLINKDCNITVLDADKRLINYINKVAKEKKLKIKAYEYNVMDEVPKEFLKKFDTLMTDPTPEKIPFTIFTNSAIDLTKDDGIIYTSIYSTAMSKNLDLQKTITDMNLYITEMIPCFTHYQYIYKLYRDSDIDLINKYNIKFDDDSICFTETLFRLEKTGKTKKIIIKYSGKDLMGKATKRAVSNPEEEVAKEDDYINELRELIINNKDLKKVSGK